MSLSLRSLLGIIAGTAVVMAFWTRFGEYMLALTTMVLLAVVFASFLLPKHPYLKTFRRRTTLAIAAIVLFTASLGPAALVYTTYDPNLYQAPKSQRAFLLVYSPVGRCMAFPVGPLRDGYLLYLRWWMPRGIAVQDIGWGVKIKTQHQHVYIGMN